IITAGVLAALAFGNTIVVLAALVAGLAGVLMVRGIAPAQAAQPLYANAAGVPREQRAVVSTDGTLRQALIVPAEAVQGYQAVLTIDGYALVNAEGRGVYTLAPEPRPDLNNGPVVGAVLGSEEAKEP